MFIIHVFTSTRISQDSMKDLNCEFKFYFILENNVPIGLVYCVFNATGNNISIISWWSVVLMKKTGVYEENLVTCAKKLTNSITYYCIEYAALSDGFQYILLVLIAIDY